MKQANTFTGIVYILIFLFFGIHSSIAQKTRNSDKYLIDAETFKSTIEKNDQIVILDVRTPQEFEESHIRGSLNVDYKNDDFKFVINELDQSKKYYVYCRSGKRSANSRKIMNELGFKKVYDLQGGILAWEKLNYPVE